MRGSSLGGAFTLTSNKGQPVSWSDFDGQYRMVYLGFTYCPSICPTDVQRMSAGLELFEKENPALARKVQPIFISVDPDRDSVAAIDEFVGNFHPRLIGLRGNQEETDKVVRIFSASAQKDDPDAAEGYNITHTTLTYLFGPEGEPLGLLPTDKGPEAVASELEGWVR